MASLCTRAGSLYFAAQNTQSTH